ncbi:MAG: YesL family protein [Clostridia bacterium]|nr:YesL family protein [Clostridia bacterium]
MPINLVYSLISVPVITGGFASVGITHVARNTARDKHSFGLSDFFDTVKKNWKQALAAGIINTIVYILLIFDIFFFYNNQENGMIYTIGLGIMMSITIIFLMMNFYLWTMMITFKFNLKQLYKNSFKFVIINIKKNLLCGFCLLLAYGLYIAIAVLFFKYIIFVLSIEILVYILTFPAFRFLLIQYFTFPCIKKVIIDPYYAEHPDEDIEKRRDLGIEVEEEKPEVPEGEEEEPENVFDDNMIL